MIMKKGLLFLLAIFSMGIARAQVEVTDVSGMDYAIYCPETNATVGQETQLPIYLKCAEYVTAFQFKLYLPDGVTAGAISKNSSRVDAADAESFMIMKADKAGYVEYMGFVASKNGIHAGDDLLLNVTISVDPSVELGEYEVKVVDGTVDGLSGKEGTKTVVDIPVLSKLIVSDAINLYDTATEAPAAMEGVNVVVNRTIKGGEWSTICLPFAMDANQIAEAFGSAEIADFASWTSESDDTYDVAGITLEFESVDAMEANHPYIIKVGSDIESFRVDGVTIEPEEAPEYGVGRGKTKGTFYGTYTTTVVPEENLFLSGNKFWYSVGTTNMKGFRGYFELRDVLDAYYEEAPVKINLTVDGTTAISNIDLVKSNNEIFSVNGIKMGNDMNRLNKGIYIVNGKKIVK